MATAFRILLWALVLIAPGGILLAPFLATYELRRRNAANATGSKPRPALADTDVQRRSIPAVVSA
jgi:hypothetical protein